MELLVATLLGAAGVYRLTSDILSPDLEGPFNLYNIVRNHIDKRSYPAWVKNGIWCKYCVSFWVGLSLSPMYLGLIDWWMVPLWGVGLSGPSVIYYNYIAMMYPEVESL